MALNCTPLSAQSSPLTDEESGGTKVTIAEQLVKIHKHGGIPSDLGELRLLEEQQRKVAQVTEACTVSVQIGSAQGCGVIVTDSGYILTAAHVAMRPGLRVLVMLSDGRRVEATTYGMNRSVDAGLMKINAGQNNGKPWPHASLGTSRRLKEGMWCVAAGHPGGFHPDRGNVTRVGRILDVKPGAIVTDCALIGGDSGGPLFDLTGRLIAVHSRIGNDVADNLHVPIDNYDFSWKRMYQKEAWGYLPGFRPILGVRGQSTGVAKVTHVTKGSPADLAGMRVGDIVERFGKDSIPDFEALKKAVSQTMPGERVRLLIRRGDRTIPLRVEIGRAED